MRQIFASLARDWLLLALLVLFPLMFWLAPVRVGRLSALVDWKTVAALAGLMVLSRGLEVSGVIDRVGRAVVLRVQTVRSVAMALVLLAALLSAIVTNDVALFVTVPLTLGLARLVVLPVGRLVIFQALAVNAGSALSPVGNPQNLFLWQISGAGFWEFTQAMLPVAGAMLGLVIALVPVGFETKKLTLTEAPSPLPLRREMMVVSLTAYPVFLWAVNAGFALVGAVAILVIFAPWFRVVVQSVDWALLLVFVLMFLNMGLAGQIPAVAAQVEASLQGPGAAFGLGAGLSQIISNVPAAIFLAPFTDEWRALAWGVNVGGFGLAIGSLANLIALRLGRQPGLWWQFHFWSLPMLALSLAAGALLLRL